MKKNDWAVLLSVFIYSYLFYRQSAGINFLIFSGVLIAFLLYRDRTLIRSRSWLITASCTLITSFCIFLYSSPLAIIANIISLGILSSISLNTSSSVLISLFLSICATGSSFVFMIIDWVNRKSAAVVGIYKRPVHVKFLLIFLPLIVALIFFLFYQSANPLFYDLTKDINLDFISPAWMVFTFGGLLLVYAFFHNRFIPGVSDLDNRVPLQLDEADAKRPTFFNRLMRPDTEYLSGIILFVMLNLLLLIVNALDLHYLWFDGKLPQGIKHKEFVHNGVGALISSVIFAILIILFYFRGQINFYEKSRWIRLLAYFWIIQNAFMIFSTAYRNDLYITESGLSYKKIGVYVYLLLTLAGLITTFIKLMKLRTNWYLFRSNSAVAYYVLVLGCIPNWDVIITDFNIAKYSREHKDLEKYLLLDLSFKNLPQLYELPEKEAATDDLKARDYYYSLRGTYFTSFIADRDRKLYQFLEEMKAPDWQSACLEKRRVYNDLYNMRDRFTKFQYSPGISFDPEALSMFGKMKSMQLAACSIDDISKLRSFKELETLDLSNSSLADIRKMPSLPALRTLLIAGNNIQDLRPLKQLRALETLDLSANPVSDFSPLLSLPQLKVLIVDSAWVQKLGPMFPHTTIQTH